MTEAEMGLDKTQRKTAKPAKTFDANQYAMHKSMSGGLLNIAVLTSNASHLKLLVAKGLHLDPLDYVTFTLIIVSMLMQTAGAILGILAGNKNINYEESQPKANQFNKAFLILASLTSLVNVLIVAFAS